MKQLIAESIHILESFASCRNVIFRNHQNLIMCSTVPSTLNAIVYCKLKQKIVWDYAREVWDYDKPEFDLIYRIIEDFH